MAKVSMNRFRSGWWLVGLVVAGLWTGASALVDATPLLASPDVPGFHLHESRKSANHLQKPYPESNLPNGQRYLEFYEVWMTVPRATWMRAYREGKRGTFPRQVIFINRQVFMSPDTALKYLWATYCPEFRRKPNQADVWVPRSPSGATIGDQSWYDLADDPPAKPSDQAYIDFVRHTNHDSLKMLVLSDRTVALIEVEGTKDKPVDRSRAEQIIRLVAAKMLAAEPSSASVGNNGVGNGPDPQPPGNPPVNDPPGSGPGNPGNQGGAKKRGGK